MGNRDKLSIAQCLGILSGCGIRKVCKGVDEMSYRGKAGPGSGLLDGYALTQQKAGHFDPIHIDVGGQSQTCLSLEGMAQGIFAGIKFPGKVI